MSKLPINLIDTITLGDCKDIIKQLPDGSVDLIVSSPPYNIGKEYETKRALDIYIEEQKEILSECSRVLSPKGSIFWQVGSFSNKGSLIPLDIRIFPILEDFNLIPRNRIVWGRQHGLHARNKFSARYETILWFTKSDNYTFNLDSVRVPQKYQNKKAWRGDRKGELTCNPNGKNPGDIWMFRNVKHNHEEQTIHPAQFPEDLIARIVLSTTNIGDVVMDPYMGAGTVAVVARDEGRHFIGAELEPRYHSVACRRLEGQPDENLSFPNLKTLRNYAEKNNVPVGRYRFDTQVGKTATDRTQSKIYPENHHLEEMEERLSYEEECFGSDRRGHDRPIDAKLNGKKIGISQKKISSKKTIGTTNLLI
ncbi:site-specific DNA-methyltransferase [Gluconobacter sphaericus]|uniref:DNA-methyltransferase n=1 Tax=Gluconobacter sphaericus TaxID=574987 RepID=UPI001B8B31A3|nr:site-specific DNA-methyltransferase [Gluconobacter sphaericus]MBS1098641.1 site-specific DNA-methyltransferase [Gluconobacter sphaericus]